ncbi:hypothetical protein CRYUN_Cryun04dG0085600 [Craigia yunnanensis]
MSCLLVFVTDMDVASSQNGSSIMWFFRDKDFDDKSINEMFKKCKRLQGVQKERASDNWSYLESIGIQERKLPSVVSRCPKILTLGLNEKLVPMVECLATLGTKRREVASAIARFPPIVSHSVEEKLCPLLAFFQAMGVPEKQLGKMILLNPWLISYSVESKLTEIVDFLATLGISKEGMIDLQTVAMNFPEVLCRDVSKILRPNFAYLKRCGFGDRQIAALVTGYPPILIKSIKNSLEPRIRFLVEVMGRQIDEVANYPDFFRHGLKKRLELRHRLLKEKDVSCSFK